jgi:plasmid maintenance system antidote protein VapI
MAARNPYLATNLGPIMRHQGRSNIWLGERLGVHRSNVCRMLSRQQRVTDEVARMCSEALGVPVWLLFEEADEARGAR